MDGFLLRGCRVLKKDNCRSKRRLLGAGLRCSSLAGWAGTTKFLCQSARRRLRGTQEGILPARNSLVGTNRESLSTEITQRFPLGFLTGVSPTAGARHAGEARQLGLSRLPTWTAG